MRLNLIPLLLLITNLTFASDSKKILIAVSDLERQNIDENTAVVITDRLRTELFKTGSFTVLERNQMKEILEEQEFQQSDCSPSECVVEAGQLLGVTHMMTGALGKVGKTFTINIRMIDVQTGRIVLTDNTDCKCEIDEVLSRSTVSIADKAASYVDPTRKPAAKKEPEPQRSFWKTPWSWVIGGVVLAGGSTIAYFMLSEPEETEKESSLGTIIPVN